MTNVSSLGMWVPVHGDEWDGDIPLGFDDVKTDKQNDETGTVTLKGDTLPWQLGTYEVSGNFNDRTNIFVLIISSSDIIMAESIT